MEPGAVPPSLFEMITEFAGAIAIICAAIAGVSGLMTWVYKGVVVRSMRAELRTFAATEMASLRRELHDRADAIDKRVEHLENRFHFHFDANGSEDLFAPEDRHMPFRNLIGFSRSDLREIRARVRDIEAIIPGVQSFIATHAARHPEDHV